MPNFIALTFANPNSVIATRTALSNLDDEVMGNNTNELFSGNGGDDQISGSGGSDYLLGNAGDDTLNGARDSDTLFGGQGHDILTGGRGKDFLSGDLGNDTLNGGEGSDTFYYDARTSATGLDQVTDFQNVDTLALDGVSDADLVQVGENTVLRIDGIDRVTFTDSSLAMVSAHVVDGNGDPIII